MPPAHSLVERLSASLRSARFLDAANGKRPARGRQITSHEAQALLGELVRLFPSGSMLEIGTYFADTSRYLAEIMVETGGHLVTIDPYGGDRIPEIVAQWPEPIQQRLTFLADNSMSFFLKLEDQRTPTGAAAPFDIVFVDGHHSFEFAFFDLMRSALYLRPGGAIVVDNIDQAGPVEAVRRFLADHHHWTLFQTDPNDAAPGFMPGVGSALLVAPEGIELGEIPYKFQLFDIGKTEIDTLQLNVIKGWGGRIVAVVNLDVKPVDLYLTGVGAQSSIGTIDHPLAPEDSGHVVLRIEPPLRVEPLSMHHPVNVEVELSHFTPHAAERLLLDPSEPLSFA